MVNFWICPGIGELKKWDCPYLRAQPMCFWIIFGDSKSDNRPKERTHIFEIVLDMGYSLGFVLFRSVLLFLFLLHRDLGESWQAFLGLPDSWFSRFWTRSFERSDEKFFTYTKLGLPSPRRFRSIKPKFSSSRSSLVALLSAQHKALLTSSIVKMMNTRPCLSNHSFLTERLMRSSRTP